MYTYLAVTEMSKIELIYIICNINNITRNNQSFEKLFSIFVNVINYLVLKCVQ